MKKSDFYFDLPERLIAQHPLEQRDASRLMVLDRRDGSVTHRAVPAVEHHQAGRVALLQRMLGNQAFG